MLWWWRELVSSLLARDPPAERDGWGWGWGPSQWYDPAGCRAGAQSRTSGRSTPAAPPVGLLPSLISVATSTWRWQGADGQCQSWCCHHITAAATLEVSWPGPAGVSCSSPSPSHNTNTEQTQPTPLHYTTPHQHSFIQPLTFKLSSVVVQWVCRQTKHSHTWLGWDIIQTHLSIW